MEKIKIEVEVPKELYELGSGVGNFIIATKEALADGWDMSKDIPAIMTAAMTELMPAVSGISKIDDEFKEDPAAAVQAISVSLLPALMKAFK